MVIVKYYVSRRGETPHLSDSKRHPLDDNRPEKLKMTFSSNWVMCDIFLKGANKLMLFLQSAARVKFIKQTHMLASIKYDGLGAFLSLQSECVDIGLFQWTRALLCPEATVPVAARTSALMSTTTKPTIISSCQSKCQFYRFKFSNFFSISLLQPHEGRRESQF